MDREHSHQVIVTSGCSISKDMLAMCACAPIICWFSAHFGIFSIQSQSQRFQIFTALQCFLLFGLQDLSVAQLLAMRQLLSKLQPYLLQKTSSKDQEGGAAPERLGKDG